MLDEILELRNAAEKDYEGAFISLSEENGRWSIIACYNGSTVSLVELDEFNCLMELHVIRQMLIFAK